MNVYTIYDSAAEYHLPPFFAQADAQAKRMFIQSLGDSFPHRADFNLLKIATFDQNTGVITSQDPISILAGRSISETFNPKTATASFTEGPTQ